MRVMSLVGKKFALIVLVLGLLLLGCAQQGPQPTAIPTAIATATPSAAPTAVPTETPVASVEPTASPEPSNPPVSADTKETAVENYLNAVKAKDYDSAYALVSSEFKKEDSEAATVESFKTAVARDLPEGFSFSGVRAAFENQREVLVSVGKPGWKALINYSFVVVQEGGGWKLRVPFASEGKYYNAKTKFQYNSAELSRFLERAVNDYFLKLDSSSSFNSSPFSFSLFDRPSLSYYGSKRIKLKKPNSDSAAESTFEIIFGPPEIVSDWDARSNLNDGRAFSFRFWGSVNTGGDGTFGCYSSLSASSAARYKLSFKMDAKMTDYYLDSSPNPFKPVFEGLSKGCPP